ncbi:MAG: transporter substrate-binding domain-containing protein [Anaerovoracaceae bacterium]|jgi:ABC-type amino acid transport substrate-binding protein
MKELKNLRLFNNRKRATIILLILAACIGICVVSYYLYQDHQQQEMKKIVKKYAEDGVLVYGADDSAPPLRYVDPEDGQYKGVSVDYINLISLELGVRIVCKPYKWENAIKAVESGETDMCDLFKNDSRAEKLVFTDPIYTLRTVVACKNNKHYSLSDLNHLRIATQSGDFANGYLKENYPGAKLIYVHDVGEGIEKMIRGKADAVIGDEPVLQYYSKKKGTVNKIHTINTALYEEPVYLGIPKEKKELVKPLNAAIKKSEAQIKSKTSSRSGTGSPYPWWMKARKGSRASLLYYLLSCFCFSCFSRQITQCCAGKSQNGHPNSPRAGMN